MQNLLFVFIFIFIPSLAAGADWSCESVDDCSEGMECKSNVCILTTDAFSSYAVVTVTAGKNNPNSLGSKKIFVEHPAQNVVLGQLAVDAYNGGDEGKYFLFKELNATLVLSSTLIEPSNIRLVYDKNGNGVFDSSEKVISSNISETKSKIKFEIDKKSASYKMNVTENFLVVGDFSMSQAVEKIWDFGIEFKPFQGSDVQILILNAGKSGSVVVTSVPERVALPRFAFEPEAGYFLFTSGKYFPSAPSWREMNKEQTVMNMRIKSLEGDNSVNSISVRMNGTIASFGNGVSKMQLYIDSDNDGDGDELISEQADFQMPVQLIKFTIPSVKLSVSEGEEKFLVIKADIEFYNGQTTLFYISENDVALSSFKQIAGLPVSTEEFKYSCDETDSDCNPAPSEGEVVSDDEGGCSLILVD